MTCAADSLFAKFRQFAETRPKGLHGIWIYLLFTSLVAFRHSNFAAVESNLLLLTFVLVLAASLNIPHGTAAEVSLAELIASLMAESCLFCLALTAAAGRAQPAATPVLLDKIVYMRSEHVYKQ